MRFLLAALLSLLISQEAFSQNRCPSCGQVHSIQRRASNAQSWARDEVLRLARGGRHFYRRTGGHPGGSCPYGSFTGTGYSSGGMPGTCTPRRRMALVADATARGIDGMMYRVRVWR